MSFNEAYRMVKHLREYDQERNRPALARPLQTMMSEVEDLRKMIEGKGDQS